MRPDDDRQGLLLLSKKALADRPLHRWLGGLASKAVLVTTPEGVAGASEAAGREFLDVQIVESYQSWMTEHVAEKAARRHRVGLVASSSEDDVLRAARIRGRLDLPGQGTPSATAYRDKVVMKDAVSAAGLATPGYRAVDRPVDLLDFLAKRGFPAVVKPRREAASVGLRRLDTLADAEEFLRSGSLSAAPARPGYWMVETFARGDFFHIDGVTASNGVLHCWPSLYSEGNAEAAWREAPLSSVLLSPDDPRCALLQAFAADVHAALPAPPFPTSFHLEAWIGPTGQIVFCEVASRTGGVGIAETYEAAFGVHLSAENVRGQCGLPVGLVTQPATPARDGGWIAFPPGHGRFAPPAGACPVPETRMSVQFAVDAVGSGPKYATHAAAIVTAQGEHAGQVRSRLEEVSAWWEGARPWR